MTRSVSPSSSEEKKEPSANDAGKKLENQTKNGEKERNLIEEGNRSKELKDTVIHSVDGFDLAILREMWGENYQFQKALVRDFPELGRKEQIELTKDYLLHIVTEIDELLKSTGKWKRVLQDDQPPSVSGIAQELIDIFKFMINIAILWKISSKDFVEEFFRKSEVNWTKLRMSSLPEKLKDMKIAVFDLDGVLAKYPENWIRFLNNRLCHEPHHPHVLVLNDLKDLSDLPWDLERSEYDSLKWRFREEGFEGNPDVMEGAVEITYFLRKQGYGTVILTRRPVRIHKRLFSDTVTWLRMNEITFDGIFWSEGEKEKDLRRLFSHLDFVVEDDPDQASRLEKEGFHVFLLDRPYNKFLKSTNSLKRIKSLQDIMTFIKDGSVNWEICQHEFEPVKVGPMYLWEYEKCKKCGLEVRI